jgi:4-hydroxyacetophenone monooxygenase
MTSDEAKPAPYGPGTVVPALDPGMLRHAVLNADIRVLLMVVFHLSGDRRWLAPPFRPRRDVRLIADEDAGLPEEVRAEIRTAAIDLLSCGAGRNFAVSDPGDALMLDMMRTCMGEDISPAYAPMMREELGFVARDVAWASKLPAELLARTPVLIVGAGVSGINLGARLKRLGIDFTVLERSGDLGGVWRDNRYPGCGVDTPNHAYSFSLGSRYRWTYYFSPRDELQDYLRRAAEEFGVIPHIRFRNEVVAAQWDEAKLVWRVSVSTPEGEQRIEANVLVSAVGQFGVPSVPDFAGAQTFAGEMFHVSEWPQGLDLRGRKVAIVGTGASAMQIVPAIAGDVAQLDIYQRSPQWARPIPRYHDALTEGAQWLLAHVPYYAAWFRFSLLWRYGDGLLPHLRKDPDWPHPERSLNRVNDRHRQEMTEHILRELGDRTDLIGKCVPTYPPYGKRILLDNGWYRALLRPNVELVTAGISRIARDGVVVEDGRLRAADVIVLSTGYQISQMAAKLNIRGKGGVDLRSVWGDDNATAHLGITVPGFPNFFMMQGPSTGLGHGGSQICQTESQTRFITAMLVQLVEGRLASVEVRQEAHDAYVAKVDALHSRLIWSHPGMSTYYRNRHGRVVSVSPFSLVEYWTMTHDPDISDFVCEEAR